MCGAISPCAKSDLRSANSLIDDMVSYYEPENIDSMKDAIFRIYNDKKRVSHQIDSAQAFLAKYSWEKLQEDLISLYSNL